MTLLQDILHWSQTLLGWQSDAVRRLFVKGQLSPQDIEDLFALLKAEHGIPDAQSRTTTRLSQDHIPAPSKPDSHVRLIAMRDLRNVNAIAENQRLPFADKGITVIYGDNGSGKSGYARVLKRACRARDQAEDIWPNAKLPPGRVGRAEAHFEIAINGTPTNEHWTDGNAASDALSSIAIFDGRCARAYLDKEDDFAYVPYGLDIFEGLAQLCNRLKARLEAESAQNTPNIEAFADLIGPTKVGKLVNGLSAKTDPNIVESLATVNAEEGTRRDTIRKSLKENNPKAKADELRVKSRRLTKIASNATEKLARLDDAALAKLRAIDEACTTAKHVAELAANKFKDEGLLLPGTGGPVWRELFEAARKFSSLAYPDKPFPYIDSDAQCLLCQQPLDGGAQRLAKFDKFVQQEAEKTAQARTQELVQARENFVATDARIGLDEETFAEIKSINQHLADTAIAFEKALTARYEKMKEALETHAWDKIACLPQTPATELRARAETLNEEASVLEKAATAEARFTLEAEFKELDARVRLMPRKNALLTAIKQLQSQSKLSSCLGAVKTNSISLKASELTEKAISKELADALNLEFKRLGVSHLQIEPQSRAEKGKALHKLRLKLPQAKTLSDILSEGEQRAIAIGSFLAEVNLSGSTGGIVFDDPVSSLDHRRRERVARRLAEEAQNRQVIVLTHDIYFVCVLMEAAQAAGVPVMSQSLVERPEGFGVTDPELPFEGKTTKDRIGQLRAFQQEIAKVHKSGDHPLHREMTQNAYRQLRDTWERAVEEVLFRQVVLRFRKGVETQRLREVVVEDADYALIDKGMTKCSNYCHDRAPMAGVAAPDPDELLEDINTLDNWRKAIEQRSQEVRNQRKA